MFIWQSVKMSFVGVGLGSFYVYARMHEQARSQRTSIQTQFKMQRDLLYQLKLREIARTATFQQTLKQ